MDINNTLYLMFYEKLSLLEDKEYLFALLTYHIAPTLTGLKPATIITLRNSVRLESNLWSIYREDYTNSFNIECIEIKVEENERILMFYNKELLINLLCSEKIIKFLSKFGYSRKMGLRDKLLYLKSRFSNNCPHEMGIFLGFPLEDVESFIENKNKKCLLVGYWKVYNNIDKAKKVFELYEKTRENVMRNVIDGRFELEKIIN